MDVKPQDHRTTWMPILVGLGVFFVLAFGITFVWAGQYEDKIAPNVSIGPVDVGGMEPDIARQAIQTKIDTMLTSGIPIRVGNEIKTLSLATLVSSDLIEDVEFSLDTALSQAEKSNRSWMLLASLWNKTFIPLSVSVSRDTIKQNVYRQFPNTETLAQDAKFSFAFTEAGWTADVTPALSGREFQWEPFFTQLEQRLSSLEDTEVALEILATAPSVTQMMAQEQIGELSAFLNATPFAFTYTDERGRVFAYTLSTPAFASMLVPTPEGKPNIDEATFNTFLDPIAAALEHPAQDARLEIDNGRVVEFVENRAGLRLDREATYRTFIAGLAGFPPSPTSFATATEVKRLRRTGGDPAYELMFIVEEPAVDVGDVNDLGIDRILGTGTSSYRGSPMNRRRNIQNGVRLLNGLLIPPGETFSLINALKPFDTDNGYLPELVIKGNKITPELGGGLCQIGTTTFRAAMNSGLPIVERRNHSIVVSYYNDPSNNNPGTDATIYEPAPDFKFLNDTGHYILFQAENLVDTQELRFTFWGTSDGRKGSYSSPVVERWIPVGETQYVETTDLEPEKEQCQEAHIGADATFDYTIVRPDGTEEKTTFTSHYRPLPRICLVGVEQLKDDLSTEDLAEEPIVE